MEQYTSSLVFFGSFLLTYLLIPKIIGIAHYKSLVDHPNDRSSHVTSTPRLGGVAFYITLLIALYFIPNQEGFELTRCLSPCLTILFVIGLKDDLVVLSARTKFISQVCTTFFILFTTDLFVSDFHQFLSIGQIPMWLTILLTIIIVVGIINAINLCDGLDGLAAGLSMTATAWFIYVFWQMGYYFSFLVALSTLAILLGFIPHNISKTKKIFMGDTGSMIIGFILAFLTLRLLAADNLVIEKLSFPIENIPVFLVFILFVPVADAVRVMLSRVIKRNSPFKPDRGHLHHVIVDQLKKSHLVTSAIITVFSLLFSALGMILIHSFSSFVLTFSLIAFFIIYCFAVEKLSNANFSSKTVEKK
jgi:UDP-GlcNAc:undecaprenyl-phosphate GlcNAc-1-phosphate transferase